MSRIGPISNNANRNNKGHPDFQEEEKKEGPDFAAIYEKVKKGLPYPPPPPRKSDARDLEQVTPHNLRYGYHKDKSLKKQILKQSLKPPANDLYF